MACFGLTDYRRPADAALVFGARAYADGRPSDALSDRVLEACELYERGLVKKLVMSGGPGDGDLDEAEVMARVAEGRGVPRRDIVLDHAGVSTSATIANAVGLRGVGISRVLAVSHFYHLPRIKLEAGRAGLEVYTVPARQRRGLRGLWWFMAREVGAWWWHLVRG